MSKEPEDNTEVAKLIVEHLEDMRKLGLHEDNRKRSGYIMSLIENSSEDPCDDMTLYANLACQTIRSHVEEEHWDEALEGCLASIRDIWGQMIEKGNNMTRVPLSDAVPEGTKVH